MSQFRTESIVCPQCNRKEKLRLWEEINAKEDVTARNSLLDGSLFVYRCKKCGYTIPIAYNCIYKDNDRNFMIYLAADGDSEGMRLAMDQVEDNANKMAVSGIKYNVRRRIVGDINSLREKVMIFEENLDDRIIELMKLFYMSAVEEKCPDMQIDACLFCIVDEGWRLEFATLDGRVFAIDIKKDLYEEFEKEYRKEIDNVGETYFINKDYAIDIKNRNQNDSENIEN